MNPSIPSRSVTIPGKRSTALRCRLSFAAIALLAWVGMLPWQLAAQAGSLDRTFGSGGIFTLSTSATLVTSLAIQSDGKILAAGMINDFPAVLRLNTNGTIDSSFGTGGVATSTFDDQAVGDQAVAVVVQPDGKILMAATDVFADNGGLGFELARFNTNGSADTTFGNGGTVNIFPFNQSQIGPNIVGASVMALQPDGRILLAGAGVMSRFETNGQLDSTFGTGGGSAVLVSPSVTAMALQTNGQILIASGGTPFLETFSTTGSIARYNSNGSLDTSFDSSGQAPCLVSGTAILVQSTGRIVVAGSSVAQLEIPPLANRTGFALVRLNANGSTDTTFGTGGIVVTGFSSFDPNATANTLVEQASGDIIAAGLAGRPQIAGQSEPSAMALVRYTAGGMLDTTFGSAGKTTTGFGANAATVLATAVQSDGKIVAVGDGDTSFTVVRYLGQ